tara:strand:+ start:190 stop:1134 length:945 start_codon:yes stop_codon:yes gene_type:complete
MLVSGNYGPLLRPGLAEIYSTVADRPDPARSVFYRTIGSTRQQEQYFGYGGRRYVPVWTGTVQFEDNDAYYRTDIRNILLVDGMAVERVLLEDDQYAQIANLGTSFAENFAVTREHDAVQTFINGFTDSGTNRIGVSTNGADGVGLLSTAHPDSPVDSGTTQANEATLALNMDNADSTRQSMLNFSDDKGNLMGVNPDMILVPAELERVARQLFPQTEGPMFEPGSAQFDANLFQSALGGHRMTVVMWNRLTDANAWFMIDSQLMKKHLIWQERIVPSFEDLPQVNPEIAQFSGRMRYGIGWTHWAWIYGQNPS